MKKITFLFAALLMVMSASADVTCTIAKEIPAGWEYITNNPDYPTPGFYAAGLKLSFEGQGIKSPAFDAQDNVEVTITIGGLNENTKTGSSDDVFTFTGLNAAGETAATAVIKKADIAAVGDFSATLQGTAITQVEIRMTAYPYNGTKFCNVALTGVRIAASGATTPDPGTNPDTDTDTDSGDATLSESFETSQGDFTIQDVVLPSELKSIWRHDSQYKQMKAGCYDGTTNHASESWLISPAINLAGKTAATLTFEHSGKQFGAPLTNLTLQVSKTYAGGAINAGDWTEVEIPTYMTGNDNTFVSSGSIDLSAYAGGNVFFAFKYTSQDGKGGNWYIKNVVVKSGGTSLENTTISNVRFNGTEILNPDCQMLHVFNATGALVLSSEQNVINLSAQAAGMYIVRSAKSTLKIVK